MGKKKTPDLPETPSYYTDPNYESGSNRLMGLGNQLTNFDFSGGLAPLASTIEVDPNVLSGYFKALQPYLNQTRQGTISQLAANNQLESSVTGNRLAQIDTDLGNTMQGYLSNLITQSNQNRINLFGTGLNAISGATGMAQGNQAQRNQFNLSNYENLVERALYSQDSKGGLWGGLTGGAGGAMAGAGIGMLLAAPTGGLSIPMGALIGGLVGGGAGGAMGALGPQGTGGQLLNAGASSLPSYIPGSSASSNPFNTGLSNNYGLLNNENVMNSLYGYKFGKN